MVSQQRIGVCGGAQNHCSSARCSTGVPSCRQQQPSTTCSVGQHGSALRTPVNQRLLAIGQAAFEHAQRNGLLIPAIIFRLAGGDFAIPVVGKCEATMRPFHLRDVSEQSTHAAASDFSSPRFQRAGRTRPSPWGAERYSAHPHVARERVANGVVANVPDVQRTALGYGKHLQPVIFRLRGIPPRPYRESSFQRSCHFSSISLWS